ncbi:MAG: hypothetical protein M3R13_02750 [Armatimonadota bacterium]|nr:hypothetical protein [Armatimonadota bacterium]
MKRPFVVSIAFLVGFILVGCARDDMWYQKKVETYEKSDFFEDGIATRLPVEGTVIQGSLRDDSLLYDGTENGAPAARFPFPVTKEKLERGQDRYGHFCLPCHGATGDGLGMVVQRGFKQPSAFTAPHLMSATPGYLFLVLKVGYSEANGGTKLSGINTSEGKEDFVHPPLLKKMGAEDVWATIAYIRALQASQSAPASSLTPEQMEEVTNPKKEAAGGGH